MITVTHCYCTTTEILYHHRDDKYYLTENKTDTMDNIAGHVCEVMVKHNFSRADVCSSETGELLLVIERS